MKKKPKQLPEPTHVFGWVRHVELGNGVHLVLMGTTLDDPPSLPNPGAVYRVTLDDEDARIVSFKERFAASDDHLHIEVRG